MSGHRATTAGEGTRPFFHGGSPPHTHTHCCRAEASLCSQERRGSPYSSPSFLPNQDRPEASLLGLLSCILSLPTPPPPPEVGQAERGRTSAQVTRRAPMGHGLELDLQI